MKVLIAVVNTVKNPDPVFPLGASYIAYHTKKAGHTVTVFDACFKDEPLKSLEQTLINYQPDIIAVSIRNVDNIEFPIAVNYLPFIKKIIKICRKNSNAKIILGGAGFSIFPELFVRELNPDYGIKGEGEYEFINLLKKIEKGNPPDEKIIYSDKIKDIDYDSFPDRNGFDVDLYYTYSGCMNIQTKRGCAFNCSYCTYPLLEGHEYRLRTPAKTVDEIEYWHEKKNMNYFFFVDNVFNHPEDYSVSICREIIKRKLKIKWTGFFIPKINNIEYIDICKESGLTGMDFGTDAFSPGTLKGLNKQFTIDDVFKACELCRKKEINFNHSLIFGGPNETEETLNETIINTFKTNPSAVIGFIGVRLYPGTQIANNIKDINIGIDPVFYVSENVKDFLIDYLKEKTSDCKNWIIPGLNRSMDPKFFERIRRRGIKGPLWELIAKVQNG